MTALKKVKSKSLTDKENKLGLNFALIKYQIKDYTKKLDLLKEQISILFEQKKQNVIFIFDEKHQGYIQDELCDSTYKLKQGRVAGHWNFNLEILVPYRKTFFGKNFV